MLILDKEARHAIRGKILRLLLEAREASFRDLLVRLPVTTLDFHLRVLRKEQIVEATDKGYRVKPERVQYFRNKFNIKTDVALIAGVEAEGDVERVKGAVAKANIKPKETIYVVNSERADALRSAVEKQGGVVLAVNSENPEKAFKELDKFLEEKVYDIEPVIDLSSAPRFMSIALMKLGEKYGLRRFLMKDGELIWI
ncbi:MAG: helix-turn-helix transcriptional regulator [Candidatus Freyarchaeota archaeon]|nr:helix-turn-helix transcriptional regulator [Candidatus Jordarchaeia archaeon]